MITPPTADHYAMPLRIESLFYREANTAYHIKEHSQPLHQWYLCVHGSIAIRLDKRAVVLGPGQSVLYRPGTLREPRCRGRAPGYLVAIFANQGLDLDPLCDQVLDLPVALRPELNALIAELMHPEAADSRFLRQALLIRLLIGQRRAHRHSVSILNAAAANGTVQLAEEFMRAHLDQPLTRSEIAAAVHCSIPHLTRIFRTAADTTVFVRLTALRLEKARALLRESDQPIGSIALATGFPSFSHFARTFKQATGMAPSAYRRTGGAAWR